MVNKISNRARGYSNKVFRQRYSDKSIPTGGILTRYSDKGIPTGVFPQGVFRQRYSDRGYSNKVFRQRYCDRGYSNRRYSDMGYFDRVYLLRVFPRVVPSAHTSPLLLKGGINLGLPNTTRMRANTPWARKRYHKRKAICGLQALLY
jgi:hypothetical protein